MNNTLGRVIFMIAVLVGLSACGRSSSTVVSSNTSAQFHPDKLSTNDLSAISPTRKEYRVLQERPDRLLVELPNRLIIVASEVRAAPVVSTQVWVKTGSLYEQKHVGGGVSHFLEHLISGGTTSTRTEEQSNALLSEIGATTNAATSLDTVRYYINTSSAYCEQAIDLLSDWMLNSLITLQEYDRERSVIQREFEMGQGEPGRILWKLTQQARYSENHPARHPTIGYLDEFLKITRDEIYAFYKRMYVPNNMVFVVVGDIDKYQVVDQIASIWQSQEPGILPSISFPQDSPLPGPRDFAGTADIESPRLRLAWPGTRLAQEGDYALDLLGSILGQGESSRLVRTVRDTQRQVNTITAYNLSFPWGEGFVGIDAEVADASAQSEGRPTLHADQEKRIELAKSTILEQIDRIRQHGVTEDELARAKRRAMASVIYNAQSAQSLANRFASDLIGMKDPDYMMRYAEVIQGVTAQQVHRAAKRFLDPSRLITIKLLPLSPGEKPAPLTRSQDQSIAASNNESINLDNEEILNQLSVQHAAANSSTAIHVHPIQQFTMPNGLRLLVGANNIVPAVAMQMYHIGGLLADSPGGEGLTHATASMRMKGTGSRTARQIADQVESLGARLGAYGGYNTSFTRGVCLKEDWETLLELLADVTLNPTFPDDEWSKLRPRLLASIDRHTDSWSGELRQYFRETYFGNHPWSHTPAGRRRAVERLTTSDLREHFNRRLGASESVLVIFGEIDPNQVASRVEQLFANMPPYPQQPFVSPIPLSPSSRLVQRKTDKPLAAVQIGYGPTVDRGSPDYASLQVLSSVMSRFPAGWLEQELRGRGPGLVYAVGAGQFTGLVPGYFSILFNTQPDAVAEALSRTRTIVERARTTVVDAQTLAAAKAKVLTEEFLYKQTNSERATDAALNELYGLGLSEPERYRQLIQQTSAEQLQDMAQRYLGDPVTVVISHQLQDNLADHAQAIDSSSVQLPALSD